MNKANTTTATVLQTTTKPNPVEKKTEKHNILQHIFIILGKYEHGS